VVLYEVGPDTVVSLLFIITFIRPYASVDSNYLRSVQPVEDKTDAVKMSKCTNGARSYFITHECSPRSPKSQMDPRETFTIAVTRAINSGGSAGVQQQSLSQRGDGRLRSQRRHHYGTSQVRLPLSLCLGGTRDTMTMRQMATRRWRRTPCRSTDKLSTMTGFWTYV